VTKLRVVPYRDLRRVAEAAGFVWLRRKGSHNTFRRSEDGRMIVIPDHGSDVIVRGLLRDIIGDMGLSIDEYHDLLDRR
jgi:predicted RNA binding protein YcfA (HicA-like mRNA interferase family)